eukprot:TRINITY_DN13919_c0_g1_i1.p1 TRINITY_DN13919_c0_g1~~TRINITY_DN13919_c0_g1_i1.p1  ORF type:complete len:246 (+),score=50.64 TRINITY_DN13919_c0_g1_i1:397-1134(+)
MAAHLGLATSGIFLGRFTKSSCAGDRVELVWKDVISHSSVPFLPSLTVLGCIMWLMLLTQPLFGIYAGVPTTCAEIQKLMSYTKVPQMQCMIDDVLFNFRTFSSGEAASQKGTGGGVAADAVSSLADSSRMVLLSFRDSHQLAIAGEKYAAKYSYVRKGLALRIEKLALRVFRNLLAESILQPNLQATALAINYTVRRSLDTFTVVSLLFGFTMALFNLVTMSKSVLQLSKLVKKNMGDLSHLRP